MRTVNRKANVNQTNCPECGYAFVGPCTNPACFKGFVDYAAACRAWEARFEKYLPTAPTPFYRAARDMFKDRDPYPQVKHYKHEHDWEINDGYRYCLGCGERGNA